MTVVNAGRVLEVVPGTDNSFSKCRLLAFLLATLEEETKDSRDVKQFAHDLRYRPEGGIPVGHIEPPPAWSYCPLLVLVTVFLPRLMRTILMCDTCSFTPKYFRVCLLKTRTLSYRTREK